MSLALRAEGLRRSYASGDGVLPAVAGIDLDVEGGELVSIMGPSGCGKSTLLHLLGGLDRRDAGHLEIGGESTDRFTEAQWARFRLRHVGFVFQAFHLIDDLTAVENAEVPALMAGVPRPAARRHAMELLARLGITDRATHFPAQLSGGQRQRVALARALANEPQLVLMDEPTGSLDSAATGEMLDLFGHLRQDGRAAVIVTHDARVATVADRLLTMRDGVILDETRLTPSAEGTSPTDLLGLAEPEP